MNVGPLAGNPPAPGILVDVSRPVIAYYADVTDPSIPAQRVAIGTRGTKPATSALVRAGRIICVLPRFS
jgi:hypothetical protein